jgi:hypothetical protein
MKGRLTPAECGDKKQQWAYGSSGGSPALTSRGLDECEQVQHRTSTIEWELHPLRRRCPNDGGQQEIGPMTPQEVHRSHRPAPDRWGAIALLLGMVAIAVIGALVLTNSM